MFKEKLKMFGFCNYEKNEMKKQHFNALILAYRRGAR